MNKTIPNRDPLYEIGSYVQFYPYTLKIHDIFVSTVIQADSREYDEYFYAVALYPNMYFTVFTEPDIVQEKIPMHIPTIAGAGAKGCIKTKNYNVQYKIWQDMLYRCYYKPNKLYQAFGGNGVRVLSKWLCFEYFMYDWLKIPGAVEAVKEYNISHVIDFNSKALDLPLNQRVYRPENCYITRFAGSQVAQVYDLIKKANYIPKSKTEVLPITAFNETVMGRSYSPVTSNSSNTEILFPEAFNDPVIYESYAPEDYQRVIDHPELALEGYAKPEDIIEQEVNPLYGPIEPHNSQISKPGLKNMCYVIPWDIVNQNKEERKKKYGDHFTDYYFNGELTNR